MKQKYLSFFILGIFVLVSKFSLAQVETRIATNCAINNLEVPINIKNLEDIKNFQLKLIFDNNLLRLDTSLYHNYELTTNIAGSDGINVSASNDTISITWAVVNNSVNIVDELLLSLIFDEVGSGEATFTWIESECFYKNTNNLIVDDAYYVDATVIIPFDSPVTISFDQFQMGCRDNSENGGCKAQVEVNIVGGLAPYEYQWRDKFNQKDSIAIGICQDPISVLINDAAGCFYGSLFDAIIYPAIDPEDIDKFVIKTDPEEVFITKPYVEFSIETNVSIIEKYEWDFGDESYGSTETVLHTYGSEVQTYMVSLRTENIDGCDTTVNMNLEIKELEFCIPNVFTPNGDGINDTWIYKVIGAGTDSGGSNEEFFMKTGISEVKKCTGDDLIFADHFKSSHLVILNRNGSKLYECTNCTEYWDGGNLPDGVYFYVFTWEGEYSKGQEQGNVTIIGSQNK